MPRGIGRYAHAIGHHALAQHRAIFHDHIRTAFAHWIAALAALVVESTGCPTAEAHRRAEDAVLSIQGALVLARGTGNTQPFQRVLKNLPSLLRPARRTPAQRTP